MPHPAAAAIVPLYDRTVDAWDAARGRALRLEGAWLDRFVAALPPADAAEPDGARAVLDLGCGTGHPMAHALLARGLRVTGVDAAPAMVARARAAVDPAHAARADWRAGDMRTLALGRRFAGVLAWHSFFHLAADDQRATIATFAAHAAPGAALMFTSGPSAGEAIGTWEGEPLHHASLDPAEYRALLAAHGFTVVAHVAEDAECGGATVWLARREAEARG